MSAGPVGKLRPTNRQVHLFASAIVLLVLAVNIVVGALAITSIRTASDETARLNQHTISRLALLGEIQGQLARVNDGVAVSFGPEAPEWRRVEARNNALAAGVAVNALILRYHDLIVGTSSERAFDSLTDSWHLFYNTVSVRILGQDAIPGWPLADSLVGIGNLGVAVSDGLDQLSQLEHAEAEAVTDDQHDLYVSTTERVTAAIGFGFLLTGGMVMLALRTDRARRRSEQRFRSLVQKSSEVISVVDTTGKHQYISPSLTSVMGYQPEDLIGTSFLDMLNPNDRQHAQAMYAKILKIEGEEFRFDVQLRHADGTWHWHEAVARNLVADPAVRGVVFNHRDITERREFQDRLTYEASHDALTGLANRAVFLENLEMALEDSVRLARYTGALYIDINEFKHINDTWGHETGDSVLIAISRILEDSVRGADTVARLGGDEFGIVLAHVADRRAPHEVANRIVQALDRPLSIGQRMITVRVSIGIALQEPGYILPDELLRRADLAMYHAKRSKISCWQLFTTIMDPNASQDSPTASELEAAIDHGQLRLQYQPVVALADGHLLGFEALVRWHHPTLGFLGPQAFIPLAESTGLIERLGLWVLRSACSQVRLWQDRSEQARNLSLSVNLSPRQLDHPSLTADVMKVLHDTGFDPDRLVLEITENALVHDDVAIKTLAELHEEGIRIALDDFGTGYSSLRYLTHLPVDILKLDRCFVAELNGTSEGSAIAEAVIRLSHALRIATIAEGIEEPSQARELTSLGYQAAQGYLFSRPLDPDAFEAMLDQAAPGEAIVLATFPGSSPTPSNPIVVLHEQREAQASCVRP